MNDLIKELRHFIVRDLVFMIGGGAVISSFLYVCPRFRPQPADHFVVFLFLAGLSYVVGYAVQDGTNLLGITRIAPPRQLFCLVRACYERLTGIPWEDIGHEVDFGKAERCILPGTPDGIRLERIISLKQVGTTVGPCSLLSAITILVGNTRFGNYSDLLLSACATGLGLLLVLLGRIKAGEQAKLLERVFKDGGQVVT